MTNGLHERTREQIEAERAEGLAEHDAERVEAIDQRIREVLRQLNALAIAGGIDAVGGAVRYRAVDAARCVLESAISGGTLADVERAAVNAIDGYRRYRGGVT